MQLRKMMGWVVGKNGLVCGRIISAEYEFGLLKTSSPSWDFRNRKRG